MNTVKFHPQGSEHLYAPFRARATPCGWQTPRNGSGLILSDNGTVTCPDCLEYMAAFQVAMGPQQMTVLYAFTDYRHDNSSETLLAVFADAADAERNRAALTASIPDHERSTLSYNTHPCTVLPLGSDYTGGPYGE